MLSEIRPASCVNVSDFCPTLSTNAVRKVSEDKTAAKSRTPILARLARWGHGLSEICPNLSTDKPPLIYILSEIGSR